MSHGSTDFNQEKKSNSRSRHRNQHRRSQHRRHEEIKHQAQAPSPSSLHHHHHQSQSQSRNQPHTHSHSKPKSTNRKEENNRGSLTRSKSVSSSTTFLCTKPFATSSSSTNHHLFNSSHTLIPTAKSRTVEYSANSSAAGWELRPHIPLVLALTSCGIILLLMVAGLTFVMLWRRRTFKLERKRLSRERRVREDGRREGLEMRLEGLGIELEDHHQEGENSISFEGRDKDGNLVEGMAIKESNSDSSINGNNWKDSNSYEKKPITPMLQNENWNQESLLGSSRISSPKAAFISSVHHHQSSNKTNGGMVGGGSWRTLIPRKGKGGNGNDFQGTIEQYVYTPEITIESSNSQDMWSSFNTGTAEKNDGFGLGIGIRSQTNTPGGSPIADGWGGFLKRSRSPIQNQNQNPTSPSSTLNQQSQPGGSTFSSITDHQHERFGKAFDQMDLALDLAPAYSDAYAAAAPSRRFLESPSQVNTKDSTSRIGRFSFGLGAATMAAGLTRKLSRKLDVRKSMKFFSSSDPNRNQPPYQVHQNQIIIPGPITYQLNDTPALGELEFVTAPLASPGMSNPFDSAFARPNSPLDQQHRSTSPLVQSHLRPALDRFDSGASTLVPSRASQPSSSLGRKQSSRTTVIDESEEREEEEDEIEVEERNGEEEVEALNSRLSSSTIEKGLLWRTLPGGALRDGEPLGVAKDDQLMAISASSSEASLLVRRDSNRTEDLRNQESSADQIVFAGPSASSRISNLESSSIGLGISMEEVGHSNSEDVVEKVYRSVQQLVREGLGTPRKRNRAVSDARSIGFPMDTSIDPDFSIGAITIRSRSATMESTRSTHFQKEKGRKRSGTVDSIHSTLTRRRANSEGRRRTLVTDEIDKFYPGGATKLSRQNRSRKSSGASSLAVPSRVSMGNRSIRNGENQDKHLSSASTASVWSRDSRPSSYVPIFNNQETRDSIQPPPVPEKDRISPQLNEASTALRNFFDSPSQGKRRKLEDSMNTSSPQPQSRFSPFETPSIESPKVFTSSAFASIEPSLPAFPSSATISPRINYPQPKPNSKGLVHPVELQMRLEDAREEILGNGKGGQSFYPSTSSYTPVLSSSTKVSSSRLSTSKGDRTLIKSLVATHQTSVSTPEEYDSSYCGNASADTWSTFAGDDSIVSMEINNKASGSNTVRISSALDPRRSGSFVSKTTTRHRSSHASQTPIVTVTEAFEPVNEEISNSSVYSNSESAQSSTSMKLLSSSPKSPSSLHRSRTTSGDSRRSRENSFGDDVSKSPRTRPRGATIPAPRAALRGARAAAAALAAASGLQIESGSTSDIRVESPRIGSPRVAFAPLVEPSSSRPSSPRVAFADECNSISSSVSNSPQEKKSISNFESPMCSSPLRKNSNPPSHSSISNISEKKDLKNRSVKSMSSSKRRAPSNLRIDTSARKPQSQRSNTTSSNEFDTSEEIVTPILVGSDNSTSSDSLEDESFSPTSTISIRSSFIPLSIASTESRSRDLISHRFQLDGTVEVEELKNDGSINSKTNSLLSANLSESLTSLKRGRPITPRTSDYASPTMLVFRFYESEMEER